VQPSCDLGRRLRCRRARPGHPALVFKDHDKQEAVPASLALGPDGNLYVSAWSIADRDGTVLEGKRSPGGQVWKILGF
jgi:hypothetical protein